MSEDSKRMIFSDLSGDSSEGPTEVESMCPDCYESGITKLLLTRIPHYGDVIIASFSCEHCGCSNNEIRPGGKFAEEMGVSYTLKVSSPTDLNRSVVKSDWASVSVPSIELEIPSQSQKGEITTIEGILERTSKGLLSEQAVREIMDPEAAQQIKAYVQKIEALIQVTEPWEISIRDISGQSFIENLNAPRKDPLLTKFHFKRTKKEDETLGIFMQEKQEEESNNNEADFKNEVLSFKTNCPNCNSPTNTNMKLTDIPHFKEVVIMAMVCDYCGHKTNEVKSGGGIEAKGSRITLAVKESYDLCRDVLKSETCSIIIPELEFEMTGYSIGGKFTTLEGLLNNVKDTIESNPLLSGAISGDSSRDETNKKLDLFKIKMEKFLDSSSPFTIILDDPAGNSYIQNLYAPEEDPQLHIENYERSEEQNEVLGLNDMKVEDYYDQDEVSATAKLVPAKDKKDVEEGQAESPSSQQ